MKRARPWMFWAVLSGIAAVIASTFIIEDIGRGPAILIFTLCVAACLGLATVARTRSAEFRYRITTAYAPFLIAGGVVVWGLSIWLVNRIATNLGADFHTAGKIARVFMFFAIPIVITVSMQWGTLFQGWWHNVWIRRSKADWNQVGAVIVTTGSAPGTVEIGIRPSWASPIEPIKVRPGEVLTDLPLRVVIKSNNFDFARLHWAVNQSGRTDIALLERTPGGERLIAMSNGGAPQATWLPPASIATPNSWQAR